jgi:hypothetical protein
MYNLATVLPVFHRLRFIPSRSVVMLLMMALNELLLGAETYSAHIISGTIRGGEWVPIIYGPLAAALLLLAGLLARRRRTLGVIVANVTFLSSAVVGFLGAYYHLHRALQPFAPLGEQVSVPLLVWAPPILAPLTFALIGLLGISASWIEDPPDSGVLVIPGGRRIAFPFNKSRAFFLIVGMGNLATLISSVLDHARSNFSNPWVWVPLTVGIFGTAVALTLGFIKTPRRADLAVYLVAMLLMILTGMIGLLLHIRFDLTTQGAIVFERMIRGAPVMAPMLFADMGTIGLIALLDPRE